MTHGIEGRERFLRAIAERVPVERVEEVHLFPSIRQGARESGVAVIALRPAEATPDDTPAVPSDRDFASPAPASAGPDVVAATRTPGPDAIPASAHDEPPDDSGLDTDAPLERGERPASDAAERVGDATQRVDSAPAPRRFDVWTATYALTLKGPERGAWEMDVTEEALAPADTIDAVVRGVHRRAGGLDEPERLSADAFRAALVEEPWTTAR